jgi:prephenate dehydrogenase
MQFRHLSILGVGLLGGSIGLAAKRLFGPIRVSGYGHRQASLDQAVKLGAIDEGSTDVRAAVQGADLTILCTPVGTFESLLRLIAPGLDSGAIVTDVGSTKSSVVTQAEATLPAGVHFVGSHPMAGSERRGVEFSRADLFNNASCILTPTDRTDAEALRRVDQFWRDLGMRTVRLSPQDHDRQLAEVSHLPHALASALVAIQDEAALKVAGKGFWDTTRIASGDAGLWRDIFLDNRANLQSSLKKLRNEIDRLMSLLSE